MDAFGFLLRLFLGTRSRTDEVPTILEHIFSTTKSDENFLHSECSRGRETVTYHREYIISELSCNDVELCLTCHMGQTLSCLGAEKSRTQTKSRQDDHRVDAEHSKVKPEAAYVMPLRQPLSDLWRAQTMTAFSTQLCRMGCDSDGWPALTLCPQFRHCYRIQIPSGFVMEAV